MSDQHGQHQDARQNPPPPAAASPKPRVIQTSIDNGIVQVTRYNEPLFEFDTASLAQHQAMYRDLAAYGAATLLRQGAGADDPMEGLRKVAERLSQGAWQPGRRPLDLEPEPIVEALAQHLGLSIEAVTNDYLPKYCRSQDHVRKDGNLLMARAKRELERHPDLAGKVGKILAERARRSNRGHKALDLAALGGDERREAAE